MTSWNAAHYLKFGDERTRAAEDLLSRIKLENPRRIADLGCGPGNSTRLLHERWPTAQLVGIDNSAEMLGAAHTSFPQQVWLQADLARWQPVEEFDLLFSNAALQWLSDHGTLVPRLFSCVARGGALAFQIPSSSFATVRELIHEISFHDAWNDRMDTARKALTMENPSFYYDALVGEASHLDIWEAEYHHILDSKGAIVDWIASTGLRPFLAVLDTEQERHAFLNELRQRVDDAYESRVDGRVLYPFRRTFAIAYR